MFVEAKWVADRHSAKLCILFYALLTPDYFCRATDINGVTCILNYDLPNAIDDYVHWISHVGNIGKVISFYDGEDSADWRRTC